MNEKITAATSESWAVKLESGHFGHIFFCSGAIISMKTCPDRWLQAYFNKIFIFIIKEKIMAVTMKAWAIKYQGLSGHLFVTVFCACLNKHAHRLLNLTGYISETIQPIWMIFSAFKINIFRSRHGNDHCNQTRLWVRFLPPWSVLLLGEIWYFGALIRRKTYFIASLF